MDLKNITLTQKARHKGIQDELLHLYEILEQAKLIYRDRRQIKIYVELGDEKNNWEAFGVWHVLHILIKWWLPLNP